MAYPSISGVWRATGADPRYPGVAHVLMVVERAGRVTGTDTYLKGRLQGVVKGGAVGQQVVGTFRRQDGTHGRFAWVTDGERFHGMWEAGGVRRAWSGVRQGAEVQPGLHAFLGRRGTPLQGWLDDPAGEAEKLAKQTGSKIKKDVEKRVNKEIDKAKKAAEKQWEKVQKSIPGFPDSSAGGDKVKADLEKATAGGGVFLKVALGVAAVALIVGVIAFRRP